MSVASILSVILLSLVLSTLLVRYLWIAAAVEKYTLDALYYCHRHKVPLEVSQEMGQIWPLHHIILELWHWDFDRYIVHQDHLESMNAFIAAELQRKDLDLARWEEENAQIDSTTSNPNDKTPPSDTPSQ